ncbi:MAG: sulfotransferase [Planctomycetaceae bacterium]|nr:sulfotransferase [Planctomycetales bacterium]MCB9925181.1 sulfotransferase [Planctomycetaceae bacterium]
MKLDFAIPGFSKCGTTTLCSLLAEHDDIFIPEVKEPNFFTWKYDQGWDWIQTHFNLASEHQLWGDGSTSYSAAGGAELACQRILKDFPATRFIFIARNPVHRLESSFREFHHSGYQYGLEVPDDINEALQSLPNMIADSRYWSLINVYRDRVPDDRILVLFLEDFKKDPAGELRKCFTFLGVDPDVRIRGLERRLNSGSTKYTDTNAMRVMRRNQFVHSCLSMVSNKCQEKWASRLGLRKPFTLPIKWTTESRARLIEALGDEINNFLKFYGKPEEFWGFETWASSLARNEGAAA